MILIELDLPAEVVAALNCTPAAFAGKLRLAAAIHWYRQGRLSQECAAGLAGLDRTDFLLALARERIDVFVVDPSDLKRELRRDEEEELPPCNR